MLPVLAGRRASTGLSGCGVTVVVNASVLARCMQWSAYSPSLAIAPFLYQSPVDERFLLRVPTSPLFLEPC